MLYQGTVHNIMNKSVQFLEYYFVMEIKKMFLDVHCLVATTLDKYLNGYISVLLYGLSS